MYSKTLLNGAIFSVFMALTACAVDTSTKETTAAIDDSTLNRNVMSAVHAVSGVNPAEMNVSTHNGVVTLTGRTQSRTQAQDAIEAARHVPGVQKVDYDISVDQP